MWTWTVVYLLNKCTGFSKVMERIDGQGYRHSDLWLVFSTSDGGGWRSRPVIGGSLSPQIPKQKRMVWGNWGSLRNSDPNHCTMRGLRKHVYLDLSLHIPTSLVFAQKEVRLCLYIPRTPAPWDWNKMLWRDVIDSTGLPTTPHLPVLKLT